MPTRFVLGLLAVPVLLAGCFYSYKNPAEVLAAGQATGIVVADQGAGTPAPFPGVSVSLKGAAFDQTTHESGRFILLELPVGRHALLFRKGTEWSAERDVEIAFGKDGQPEGVNLGQVALHATAAVEGTFATPFGNVLQFGVVVDEATGQTANLVQDPASPAQATFRFPALGQGTHLLKVAATDNAGGRWVSSPRPVAIAGTATLTLPAGLLAGRPASAAGRIRFRVQQVGTTTANLATLRAELRNSSGVVLGPFAPDSQGYVDETVPEGDWFVVLVGGGLVGALSGPATRQLATVPGAPLPPPAAPAVVVTGSVAEVGTVYLVSDVVAISGRIACLFDPDCGQQTCHVGSCTGEYVAPGAGSAGAGVSFCAPCTFNEPTGASGCPSGRCVCPDSTGQTCQGLPPTPSYCPPRCGETCTPEGTTTLFGGC